jgi:hypothetical protein
MLDSDFDPDFDKRTIRETEPISDNRDTRVPVKKKEAPDSGASPEMDGKN